MELSGYGIAIDLPPGWDGVVFRLTHGWPTLHAATFALPPTDAAFASGALAAMPDDGILVVLTEYEPQLGAHGLFAPQGVPTLTTRQLSRRAFTRLQPNRLGVQRFFTESGRAFCLYLAVGVKPDPGTLVRRADAVLSTVTIAPIP